MDVKANTLRIFKNVETFLNIGTFSLNGEQAQILTESRNFMKEMIADMEKPAPTAEEPKETASEQKQEA